ncbi:MAG: cysteine peptidase family C39 domain-containing protein [Tepidisphaeraceae bacterium]
MAILQSIGAALLAVAGASVGIWFGKRRSAWWVLGFVLPLLCIIAIGLPRRFYPLGFVMPFKWLVAGRIEFALVGFFGVMLMFTPIVRLPDRRRRVLVGAFVVIFALQAAVLLFLMPALQRSELAALTTTMSDGGVCRQSTDYTCGPAAAVTALRHLNLPAEEAELALLASTSRSTGTEPDVLAEALTSRYGSDGLHVEYRPFKDASELPADRPTVALINYRFLVDHYVTVLGVEAGKVIVADPLDGRISKLTPADFEREWRHVGLVLSR